MSRKTKWQKARKDSSQWIPCTQKDKDSTEKNFHLKKLYKFREWEDGKPTENAIVEVDK